MWCCKEHFLAIICVMDVGRAGGDLGEIRNSVSGLTLRIKVLTLGKNGDNISEPTLIIRGLSLVNLVTAFLN